MPSLLFSSRNRCDRNRRSDESRRIDIGQGSTYQPGQSRADRGDGDARAAYADDSTRGAAATTAASTNSGSCSSTSTSASRGTTSTNSGCGTSTSRGAGADHRHRHRQALPSSRLRPLRQTRVPHGSVASLENPVLAAVDLRDRRKPGLTRMNIRFTCWFSTLTSTRVIRYCGMRPVGTAMQIPHCRSF